MRKMQFANANGPNFTSSTSFIDVNSVQPSCSSSSNKNLNSRSSVQLKYFREKFIDRNKTNNSSNANGECSLPFDVRQTSIVNGIESTISVAIATLPSRTRQLAFGSLKHQDSSSEQQVTETVHDFYTNETCSRVAKVLTAIIICITIIIIFEILSFAQNTTNEKAE
ncbi:hypothetical protein AB6A40_000957 [Gnathostoma spinigerum]|uniref:Uncharacterized protein n=1 Tax=Gnathostoma spinigerum TaxID=75299 RepID=A0ABD6EBT0_9BILA